MGSADGSEELTDGVDQETAPLDVAALGHSLWREAPAGVTVALYYADPEQKRRAVEWATRQRAIGGPRISVPDLKFGLAIADSGDIATQLRQLGQVLKAGVDAVPGPVGIAPLAGTGPSQIRTLAIFTHGTNEWVSVGGGITTKGIGRLIQQIAPVLTNDVNVIIYGCSSARGQAEAPDWVTTTMSPGGADSLAARLRDALVDAGKARATVWGHTEVGHPTRNPSLRSFSAGFGKGSIGSSYVGEVVFGTMAELTAVGELETKLQEIGRPVTQNLQRAFRRVASKTLRRLWYFCYISANIRHRVASGKRIKENNLTLNGVNLSEAAPVHPLDVADIVRQHWVKTCWSGLELERVAKALAKELKLPVEHSARKGTREAPFATCEEDFACATNEAPFDDLEPDARNLHLVTELRVLDYEEPQESATRSIFSDESEGFHHDPSMDLDSNTSDHLDETEVSIDVGRAISQNSLWAKKLKWDAQFNRIKAHLILTARLKKALGSWSLATPGDFAHAVAEWQDGQGDKRPDGVIGPNTWARLRVAMDSISPMRLSPSLTSPNALPNADKNIGELAIEIYEAEYIALEAWGSALRQFGEVLKTVSDAEGIADFGGVLRKYLEDKLLDTVVDQSKVASAAKGLLDALASESARASQVREATQLRDFIVNFERATTHKKVELSASKADYFGLVRRNHESMSQTDQEAYRNQLVQYANILDQRRSDGWLTGSLMFERLAFAWIRCTKMGFLRSGNIVESLVRIFVDHKDNLVSARINAPGGQGIAEQLLKDADGAGLRPYQWPIPRLIIFSKSESGSFASILRLTSAGDQGSAKYHDDEVVALRKYKRLLARLPSTRDVKDERP